MTVRANLVGNFVNGHGVEASANLGGAPRTRARAGGIDIAELGDAFELWVFDAPAFLAPLGSEVRVGRVGPARQEADLCNQTTNRSNKTGGKAAFIAVSGGGERSF